MTAPVRFPADMPYPVAYLMGMKHGSSVALLVSLLLALAACRAPDGEGGTEASPGSDAAPAAGESATPVPNPDDFGY